MATGSGLPVDLPPTAQARRSQASTTERRKHHTSVAPTGMIAKITEEIPQNARNRFTDNTHHGLGHTGARPMHRLAATSDGISVPPTDQPAMFSHDRRGPTLNSSPEADQCVFRLLKDQSRSVCAPKRLVDGLGLCQAQRRRATGLTAG